MDATTIRHWGVALTLAAIAGITAASAAGFTHHGRAPAARTEVLPVPDGDLGEVVVHAPHDLGEIIVHAPHDLGEVLVTVRRDPVPFLAEVVVTAQRATIDAGAAMVAVAR